MLTAERLIGYRGRVLLSDCTLPGSNPTHVAVALKYDKASMSSPVVLAKGYDEVAQKIKAIAAENNIPMVENITLARALAREVQIGQPIKAKWFKPVAEILAAVYRLRRGAA